MTAIDLGNRFVKVAHQGQVWAVESIYAHVQGSGSGAVHYVQGSQSELVGTSWVVGHQARNHRRGIRTWLSEKHECALRLVLGVLGAEDLELDLVMSLPDPGEGDLLQKALIGEHHILVHGQSVTVVINSVQVQPEGMGIYWYGQQQGLTVPRTLTGILDLGGGTAIATLVDEQGSQIEGARVVLRRGGVYGLAGDIAADPRLTCQVVGTPKIELIMDGIAERSFAYGVQGVSFAGFFEERCDLWLKGILSEALNRWDPWLERIGVILVAGGAAPLAAGWLKRMGEQRWFKVVEDPQFAQVLGLCGV
ncbi:MAG: hypothetical protein Q6M54_05715 [Thermostichus sp. DRC_bins_24]